MDIAIVAISFVMFFVFFIHLFSKWLLSLYPQGDVNHAAPISRLHHQETAVAIIHCEGLDPLVLETLPIIDFVEKDFKDGIECAVCLSDISEGEKARFLPKCNHGFHMECIDMWFQCFATCPLCRNPVSGQSDENPTSMEGELRIPVQENVRIFPTNVLLWGNESQISIFGPLANVNQCVSSQFPSASVTSSASSLSSYTSSFDGNRPEEMLAIDIQRQINEGQVKSPIEGNVRMFPTNVLVCGNESQISIFGPLGNVNRCVNSQFPPASVTTSASSLSSYASSSDGDGGEGMLEIDIPMQANEEEVKSQVEC